MENSSNNEIWVFLSHANQDYEKVRQVNYGLTTSCSRKDNVLYSESGTFYVDDYGITQGFEPAVDNSFVEEETEIKTNYTYTTQKSIRTFIVPEGVKGFDNGFIGSVRIVDKFILPDTLECIGDCCFANCILPSVVIPASVLTIGDFAFGHTHIDCLQLTESLHSPYVKQFKDSYIGVLRLPKAWEDAAALGEYNELRLQGPRFDNDECGYFRWYSTKIGNLEFY